MPRYLTAVQNFIQGLHADIAPDMLPDGASPSTTDLIFDRNTLKVRLGRLNHGAGPAGGTLRTGTRALMQFVPRDGGKVRLVGVNDERVSASDTADQTFGTAISYTGFDVSSTKPPRLAQFNDYLYVADGTNAVRKCFLSGRDDDYYWVYNWSSAGAEAIALFSYGRVAVSSDDKLFVCYRSAMNGQGMEYSAATPPVHVRTYGAGASTIDDIAVDATYVYLMHDDGSGGAPNNHVYMYQRSDGALVRSFGLHDAGAGHAGADKIGTAIAIEVVGTYCYVIAEDNASVRRVKRYKVTTGAYVDDWITCDATTCPPVAGTLGWPSDVCYSDGKFYFVDGFAAGGSAYFGAVQVFDTSATYIKKFGAHGQGDGQFFDPIQIVAGGSEGHLFVFDDSACHAVEFTAGGTFVRCIGIQEGDTNGELRNPCGMGVRSDDEVLFADTGVTGGTDYWRSYTQTTLPAANFVALTDTEPASFGVPIISAPAGAAADGWMAAGDYEVCYTIDRWNGRGWDVGQPSETVQKYVAATSISSFSVSVPIGGTDTGPHRFTLWLMPPGSSNFWAVSRVYLDDFPASGSITWKTDGYPDELADTLETYIHMPPAGASLLMEWNGRMLYVGPYPGSGNTTHDTVYISAVGNADQCPQLSNENAGALYGSYLQIDTDGRAITGLGRLGSYPLVFKEEAVYLIDGETWLDFRSPQIGVGHGCIRHESIAQVGGVACVWLAADGLWGYDGQSVFEFGKPVNDLITAHARAQLELSFAVYDPVEHTYRLTVPAATAAVTYATGTSYVYHVRTQEWRVYTYQPDGAMCYGSKCATPGIYAGERYDHAVTGSDLYRLETGVRDKDHDDAWHSIAWTWWDKVRHEPGADSYKDVLQVFARIIEGASADHTITMHLRINGDSSDAASKVISWPASRGVPYVLEWAPDMLADAESYQFGISGVSAAALEINRIDLLTATRGKIE